MFFNQYESYYMKRIATTVVAAGALAGLAGCGSHESFLAPVSCEAVAPNAAQLGDIGKSFPQLARAVLQCYNDLPSDDHTQGEVNTVNTFNTINATIPLADGGTVLFSESSQAPIGSPNYLAEAFEVSMFTYSPGQGLDGAAKQSIQFEKRSVGWFGAIGDEIVVDTNAAGVEFISEGETNESVTNPADPKVVACVVSTDNQEFVAAMNLSSRSDMPNFPEPVPSPNCNVA